MQTQFLGSYMAYRREMAGLSQTELAEQLGVVVKTIQRWENDRHRPYPAHLRAIAEVLGIKPSDLLKEANVSATTGGRQRKP